MGDNKYLFRSQKVRNKSITRVQGYRIINNAPAKIGLSKIGVHMLR